MSQQDRPLHTESVKAAGTIVVNRFVGWDGNPASVQGQACAGVAQYAGVANDIIAVKMVGTSRVEAGAALNPGDAVICDNVGRAIKAANLAIAAGAVAVTSVAANGNTDIAGSELAEHQLGRVLPGQIASGAGVIVEILLAIR